MAMDLEIESDFPFRRFAKSLHLVVIGLKHRFGLRPP